MKLMVFVRDQMLQYVIKCKCHTYDNSKTYVYKVIVQLRTDRKYQKGNQNQEMEDGHTVQCAPTKKDEQSTTHKMQD